MEADMMKITMVVKQRFGKATVFGIELNPLEQKMADIITDNLLAAMGSGGRA